MVENADLRDKVLIALGDKRVGLYRGKIPVRISGVQGGLKNKAGEWTI